ncbi:hypothetical protein NMC42_05235 [Pseudomonas aeruginosa]
MLEFLQALALFVQQALLAVADQVAVAGGGEGAALAMSGRHRKIKARRWRATSSFLEFREARYWPSGYSGYSG